MPNSCMRITHKVASVTNYASLRAMDLEHLTPTDRVFIAQHFESVFAEPVAIKDASLVPNRPGVSNWVEKHGGLPKPIADMAGDLISERGMSTSHAIATAVNQAKKLCAKGNGKYCRAVEAWERLKAKSRAS